MTTSIFPHVSLRFHPGYFNKQFYLALPSTVCQHLIPKYDKFHHAFFGYLCCEQTDLPGRLFHGMYFPTKHGAPHIALGLSWRSQQWVAPFLHRDFHQPHGGVVPEPKGWCYWLPCGIWVQVGWWLVRSSDGSCHHFSESENQTLWRKELMRVSSNVFFSF